LRLATNQPEQAEALAWALWLDENNLQAARDWFAEASGASLTARVGAAEAAYFGPWADEAARRYAELLTAPSCLIQRVAVARLAALSERTERAREVLLGALAQRAAMRPPGAGDPAPQTNSELCSGAQLDLEAAARALWAGATGGEPGESSALGRFRVVGPIEGSWTIRRKEAPADLTASNAPVREALAPLGELTLHPHLRGLFVASSTFRSEKRTAWHLRWRSDAEVAVYLDGQRALPSHPKTTAVLDSANEVRVELDAGVHTVEVVAAALHPSSTLSVWVLPWRGGSEAPNELPPLLRDWLAASVLGAGGHSAAAGPMLARVQARAPGWSPAAWLGALLASHDGELSQRERQDARSLRLRQALDGNPGNAPSALELAALLRDGGDLSGARAVLDAALEVFARLGGDCAATRAELGRTLLEAGLEPEGERQLRDALGLHPHQCSALTALVDRAQSRPVLQAILLESPAASSGCMAMRQWRTQTLIATGHEAQALAELQEAAALNPDSIAHVRALQRGYVACGQLEEARRVARDWFARFPDGDAALDIASLSAELRQGMGDPADIDAPHLHAEARRKLGLVRGDTFWRDWVLDSAAVEQEAAAAPDEESAGAVYLVDSQVSRYFPDGGAAHFVQWAVRLQSERVVEDIGEITVPPGAEVLWLGTRKPGGGWHEPEDIAEKDTLSLTELEVGDVIEMATLRYEDADERLLASRAADVFSFASPSAPTRVAQFVVLYPPGEPVRFTVFSDEAEQIQREPAGDPSRGLVGERFWATAMAARPAEPLALEPGADLPRVAATSTTWAELRRALLDALERHAELPADLLSRLEELRGQHQERPEELARQVFGLIRRTVAETSGGFLSTRADQAWRNRQGERSILLWASLRAVGLDATLHLLMPAEADAGKTTPEPSFSLFTYPVVQCALPEGDKWLDLTTGDTPWGYLAPSLQQRPSLRVARNEPVMASSPRLPLELDLRKLRMKVDISPDGAVAIQWQEQLNGISAVAWRNFLVTQPRATQLEAMGKLGESVLAGAKLEELEYTALHRPDVPLEIHASFSGKLRRGASGQWLLELGLVPEELGRHSARLPSRTSRMAIDRHFDLDLEVEVNAPTEWRFERLPPNAQVDNDLTTYSRTVEALSPSALAVRKTWRLAFRILEPAAYDLFQRTVHRIDAADRLRLELSEPKSAP
jgi:tetratricopeptide (TPR) repeat protein